MMHRRLTLLAALILGFAAFAPAPAVAQDKGKAPATSSPEDDRIYDEIRQKLALNTDVRGGAIEVDVRGGIVTLTGRVRNEKARKKATELTKKVKGVSTVDNQLKLFDEK